MPIPLVLPMSKGIADVHILLTSIAEELFIGIGSRASKRLESRDEVAESDLVKGNYVDVIKKAFSFVLYR